MKLLSLSFILFFSLLSYNTFCQSYFGKEGSFTLKSSYSYLNSSAIFNKDGDTDPDLHDYTIESVDRDYRFRFEQYSISLSSDYIVSNRIKVFAGLPITYTTFNKETDTTITYTDSSNNVYTADQTLNLGDYYLFQSKHIAFGGEYVFYASKAFVSAYAEARIPFGSYNGSRGDHDYKILSDGYFETVTGLNLGIILPKAEMETSFLYNYRAEDWEDQIIIKTKANLSTVENTGLGVQLIYTMPVNKVNDAQNINPMFEPLAHESLDADLHFHIIWKKYLYLGFDYTARILGYNCLNKANYRISVGYYFDNE